MLSGLKGNGTQKCHWEELIKELWCGLYAERSFTYIILDEVSWFFAYFICNKYSEIGKVLTYLWSTYVITLNTTCTIFLHTYIGFFKLFVILSICYRYFNTSGGRLGKPSPGGNRLRSFLSPALYTLRSTDINKTNTFFHSGNPNHINLNFNFFYVHYTFSLL